MSAVMPNPRAVVMSWGVFTACVLAWLHTLFWPHHLRPPPSGADIKMFWHPQGDPFVRLLDPSLSCTADIKMFWHPQGDYLAVKVERFTKTKKSTYTGFELFSIRDKDIPMEVFELPNKSEKVHSFAWEPKGHRFAIVHGDGPRPSISFYTMRDEKGKQSSVRLLGEGGAG